MPGLQTVYQLQAAELERGDVACKLQEAERGLGESELLRQAREGLQGEEARQVRLRIHVRDLELELKGLTSRIEAGEQRLYSGEVRNPKELENLQADLRHLRARRDGVEDSILAGLTDTDDTEARLQQARTQWDALHSAWQKEQARLQALVAELRAQAARLDERIAQLRAALPAPLREEYEEISRKKGGRGIAAIRSGLCEGCRVLVPTSIVQQVRRSNEIIRCGSCGRMLCVAE